MTMVYPHTPLIFPNMDPMSYSMGFSVPFSPEQKLWICRVKKYPLWFRYAPKHIQEDLIILCIYGNFRGEREDIGRKMLFPNGYKIGIDWAKDYSKDYSRYIKSSRLSGGGLPPGHVPDASDRRQEVNPINKPDRVTGSRAPAAHPYPSDGK